MKSISLAFVILSFGVQGMATSPYYGPWASKTVGSYSCRIKPHAAVIKKNGVTTTVRLNMTPAKLRAMIIGAGEGTLVTTGLHMRKTDPAVVIEAGVFPEVQAFTVYRDSSRIVKKSSDQAAALIKWVNSVCK